jgi:hypothetical protein
MKYTKQEYQAKADQAAKNIKHAANKEMAVRKFLHYLFLSI